LDYMYQLNTELMPNNGQFYAQLPSPRRRSTMLPTTINKKDLQGMKYPNKDGIRNLNMSNADVVKEMQTIHVQASEIPNNSKLTPLEDVGWKIEDWSKDIHGVAAQGYLNDDSPLQFFNRQGHNWRLMVLPRDVDSPIKKFLWVLATNKTAGARNFLLQVLQDHSEVAFVCMDDEVFLRIIEELDVTNSVYNEKHISENIAKGIAIIEGALFRRSELTVDSIEAMIQK
jgi:hypothetical protein